MTSLSWMPSEAVGGLAKMLLSGGLARYDAPSPDLLTPDGAHSLEALRRGYRASS